MKTARLLRGPALQCVHLRLELLRLNRLRSPRGRISAPPPPPPPSVLSGHAASLTPY